MLGLLLLLCSLAPTRAQATALFAATQAGQADQFLRDAEDALKAKDYARAIKALQAAVELNPNSIEGWFNLAYAYSGLNENQEAEQAYEKTLSLQPDLFEARLNLGILLVEANRAQEALVHLQKAAELKPEHVRAHLYYGRALRLAGQPDRAQKEFQQALDLDPKLAIAYFDLGQLYLDKKKFEDAQKMFAKAAELDPNLVQAELGIAIALEGFNQSGEAISHFEHYLARKPDDLDTRFHLAKIELQQGKNEEALANLETVHKADPRREGVAAALGDVNALLKQLPESEKFYREAVMASPSQPDLHRVLAQTLLDEQKYPEAEAEFRAALKLDPRSAEAARGLATSLYLQKHYAQAIPLLEQLTRAPDVPKGLFFVLATCYDDLQQRPQALAAYEHYLEISHGENPDQEWQARQRAKLLRRVLRK